MFNSSKKISDACCLPIVIAQHQDSQENALCTTNVNNPITNTARARPKHGQGRAATDWQVAKQRPSDKCLVTSRHHARRELRSGATTKVLKTKSMKVEACVMGW
jgi:hypothetical protein